ncbi:MAG: hypothetical protein GC154_20290 [bacterium]|nr:hypothetical protein [bacterium]
MGKDLFLLYLKALIWSVFVSYSKSTVSAIGHCLREGRVLDQYPEFKDSHLGDGLRYILTELPGEADRILLAESLKQVKASEASTIYQNMVIEVGHYVSAKEWLGDAAPESRGVVYCIDNGVISVLFSLPGRRLVAQPVRAFEIMPIYTLTVSDTD